MTEFTFYLPSLEKTVSLRVPNERAHEYSEALETLGFEDATMKRLAANA